MLLRDMPVAKEIKDALTQEVITVLCARGFSKVEIDSYFQESSPSKTTSESKVTTSAITKLWNSWFH